MAPARRALFGSVRRLTSAAEAPWPVRLEEVSADWLTAQLSRAGELPDGAQVR
jgi:hypothetical protein